MLLALPQFLFSFAVVVVVTAFVPAPFNIVVLGLWLVSGALIFVPSVEAFIATHVFGFRMLTEHEAQVVLPAWKDVTERIGVRGDQYLLRVEDSDFLNASAGAGHIVSVTTWAVENLSAGELRAILAHELGHHLGGHAVATLLTYWYSMPGRYVIRFLYLLRRIAVSIASSRSLLWTLVGVAAPVLLLGLVFAAALNSRNWFIAALIVVAVLAPPIVAWAGRSSEHRADSIACEMGFGPELHAALSTIQQLEADTGATGPGLRARMFASHPDTSARIQRVRAWAQPDTP